MTTCHGPPPPEDGGGAVQRQPLPPGDHEDQVWALLQSLPTVAIRGFHANGAIFFWNEASSHLLGYTREEALGQNMIELLMPRERQAEIRSNITRAADTGELPEMHTRQLVCKDGSRVEVLTCPGIIVSPGQPAEFYCIDIDITARQRAEEALMQKEEFLRLAFENSPLAMLTVDLQGCIIAANQTASDYTGLTVAELAGRPVIELLAGEPSDDNLRQFRRLLAGKIDHAELETRYRRCGREDGILSARLALVHGNDSAARFVVLIAEDVTDQRRLDRQLQHAQKLESVGVLAGGIAHDFNNLLMGILGNANLAQLELGRDHPAHESIDQIVLTVKRAAELCKQLLAYGGRGQCCPEDVDLSELVLMMAPLLRVTLRSSRLQLDLADDLPLIQADHAQMRQLVMNLVSNAAEAITEDAGEVRICTQFREIGARDVLDVYGGTTLKPGSYLVIEVSDTGTGIDASCGSRIFDPFYTTKFPGRGLGLAAVLGIVRGHGGGIQVHSQPDQGATFRILLPVTAATAPMTSASAAPATESTELEQSVLVVDDDPAVRDIASRILQKAGYQVTTVADGFEAVRQIETAATDYALVLLDMTMPGISGEETYRLLREQQPDLRIVLSSGYNEQEVTDLLTGDPHTSFIQKPYAVTDLQAKVASLLARIIHE